MKAGSMIVWVPDRVCFDLARFKLGFHYLSSRAELTARELGCIFWRPSWRVSKNAPELTAHQLGCQKTHPSSRAVNLA